jgi:hypothetical protein
MDVGSLQVSGKLRLVSSLMRRGGSGSLRGWNSSSSAALELIEKAAEKMWTQVA